MFSFELTLLTFSVSYMDYIIYIYIYTYVVRLRISVKKGGGGAVNFGSLFSFPDNFVFSVMTSLSSV